MASSKKSSSKGAGAQKIRAGGSGKMTGNMTVGQQKAGVTANTNKQSSKSYAKGGR
jgi:hypothetical protein